MQQRRDIRLAIRQLRRQLDPIHRTMAALKLAERLCALPLYQSSQHIACYLANDGEIDLSIVMQRAWQAGKSCYLPALSTRHEVSLDFYLYQVGDPLQKNRFGIWEPVKIENRLLDVNQLDLVLAPLVAFDKFGNRLGMGGGYYDHTFTGMHNDRVKPIFCGVAYEMQKIDKVPSESWDLPMHAIVTDEQFYQVDG